MPGFKVAGVVIIFLLSYLIREPNVNERCSMDRGQYEQNFPSFLLCKIKVRV
jgi:hypothetical protein